jgi:hypothetical protein
LLLDANDDGFVSGMDLLPLVNYLNSIDMRRVAPAAAELVVDKPVMGPLQESRRLTAGVDAVWQDSVFATEVQQIAVTPVPISSATQRSFPIGRWSHWRLCLKTK